MKLTKQSLRLFLKHRPAISPAQLAVQAGAHRDAITELYNKKDRNLTADLETKLMKILPLYGWH